MIQPTFEFETTYWKEGITRVAGVDEVGMGALAGPVVAAAVIFSDSEILDIATAENIAIRDSKTLSEKQREKAVGWIQEHAAAWAIHEASVEEITKLNIRNAAHLAMQRAVDSLSIAPELILVDGTPAHIHPIIPATNIIDGDALSLSIAAASILAKVHRDNIMKNLDTAFPGYGFASHKGYGSRQHLEALREHGVSPHHRTSYAPVQALLTKTP